jgi:hypothetical protein
MSDSEGVRTIFCTSCGKARSANAKFCGSCGTLVSGQQSPASLDDPSRIETNLRRFRARLTASCPNCRYHGLMGWNDFHFPMAKAVWMPLALILCLVGIIPGLIVFLLVQRGKRYKAECPNCGQALLLNMKEAQPAKSSWGGAQFYDSNSQKVSDSKMLARGGKWLLMGAAGLVGLFVIFAALGMLIERSGIKVPSSSEPAPSAKPVKDPSPSYREYTSANLVQEYVNNAIRADQQLKGATIIVRGTVTEIGKDDGGNYYIGLNGMSEDSLVKCLFSDEHTSQLAHLEKGANAAFLGRVHGWVQLNVGDVGVAGRVDLTECSIAPARAEPLDGRQSQTADMLRPYDGKAPDRAFWQMVGGIFEGNVVGMGSGASIALEGFESSLEKYTFAPCIYDSKTDTLTVTWKTTWKPEEGDIAAGFSGVNAIAFRVTHPAEGIVATWDDSTNPPRMTFYGHDHISPSDVSSLKKGDFRSLPPALGQWAANVIRQSGKAFQVSVE